MLDTLDEKKLNKLFEEGVEESEGYLMQDLNTFNKIFQDSKKIQENDFFTKEQKNIG